MYIVYKMLSPHMVTRTHNSVSLLCLNFFTIESYLQTHTVLALADACILDMQGHDWKS